MSAFGIDWFGLVIPGRPILVNFEMVDPTKCAATIERPGEVAEICFFLTPSGAQLPPDKCAVLYLSLDGAAWTLLGTLSLAKPSGLFRLPSDDARADLCRCCRAVIRNGWISPSHASALGQCKTRWHAKRRHQTHGHRRLICCLHGLGRGQSPQHAHR